MGTYVNIISVTYFPAMTGSSLESTYGTPRMQATAFVAALLNATTLQKAFAANGFFALQGVVGVPQLLTVQQYSAGALVASVAPPPAPSPPPPYPPTPTPPPAANQAGKGADGYLGGCTFYSDANNNGALDAGEVSAVSSPTTGAFTLSVAPYATLRLLPGGNCTDTGTGLAVASALSAPAGYKVVSPVSTVAASVLVASPGISVASATLTALTALGLTQGTPLSSYDFVAGAVAGDAYYASALSAVTKVAAIASVGAALLGSPAAAAAVYTSLASSAVSAGSGAALAMDDPTTLGTVLTNAVTASGVAGLSAAQARRGCGEGGEMRGWGGVWPPLALALFPPVSCCVRA